MPSIKEIYNSIGEVELNANSINLNVDGLEALASTQQADVAAIKADLADGIPVSVASLPLPTGASTSANQTTANTSLSNIDTDLGAPADSAASSDTGSFSLISLIKRLLSTKLPNLSNGRVPVDGSGVTQPVSGTVGISGTVPVSGTFWQATQPVSGTVTAAQTTAANLNATVIGSGSFTAAQATAANLNATVVGSGSFTAQQATAANLNATVFQGTATSLKTQAENYQGGSAVGSANPLQVTLANTGSNATAVKVDNSGVTQPVSGTVTANITAPSGAITNQSSTITTGGTSQQVAASNASRKYFAIQNISDTDMYLGIGYTPTTTTGILLTKSGGGFVFESNFIPTQAINILCATTGKAFAAWEG